MTVRKQPGLEAAMSRKPLLKTLAPPQVSWLAPPAEAQRLPHFHLPNLGQRLLHNNTQVIPRTLAAMESFKGSGSFLAPTRRATVEAGSPGG